jgi:hypothetical protein
MKEMTVNSIVAEVIEITTDEQKRILFDSISGYKNIKPHKRVAYGIASAYNMHFEDSDKRLCSLLDEIMRRYQYCKNKTTSYEQLQYKKFINKLSLSKL